MAVRVGSASTLASPFFISAFRVTVVAPLGRLRVRVLLPVESNCESRFTEVPPTARVMLVSTPSWSSSDLEISATLTSSITCCAPLTRIMLMTWLLP